MNALLIVLGIIEVIICSIAFFFKKKYQFLVCICTYNLILLVQYLIQGYFTEISILFIDIFKAVLFYFYDVKDKKPQLFIIILFELIFIFVGIFTFENWFSLLIVASSMIGTFAQWQSNMLVLRISYVICSILLIINYIFTGLYTTIIAESISLVSAIISIIKYHILNKTT